MEILTGTCRFCRQMQQVKVGDDREYTQEEVDKIASEECNCEGAQLEKKKHMDISRCEQFIAQCIQNNYPKQAEILEMNLRNVADDKIAPLTFVQDGYKFTLRKTKKRTVDIDVRWQMVSNPDMPIEIEQPEVPEEG